MSACLIVGGGEFECELARRFAKEGADVRMVTDRAKPPEDLAVIPIKSSDAPAIVARAREIRPCLTVIGGREAAQSHLAAALTQEGFPVLGPSAEAARLELASEGMEFLNASAKFGVRTPPFRVFADLPEAHRYLVERLPASKPDDPAGRNSPLIIRGNDERGNFRTTPVYNITLACRAVNDLFLVEAEHARHRRVVVQEFVEGTPLFSSFLTDSVHIQRFPEAYRNGKVVGSASEKGLRTAQTQQNILRAFAAAKIAYRGFVTAEVFVGRGTEVWVTRFWFRLHERVARTTLPTIRLPHGGSLFDLCRWAAAPHASEEKFEPAPQRYDLSASV